MSFPLNGLLPPGFLENVYNPILQQAHNTFSTKVITLKKLVRRPSTFKEDDQDTFNDISLSVLINYNYMRTWPIEKTTETGRLDMQSMQVYLNKEYLKSINLLTTAGNLDYNPDTDLFVVDGLVHRAMGDTPAAQAGSEDIFFTVILQREESNTGDYNIR